MNFEIISQNGTLVAVVASDQKEIKTAQDALELIANCGYQGAQKIIVHEQNLNPQFFDLKSGLAGDVLQKFSNYNASLAVVGDFAKFDSKSLRDFIYESNKGNRVCFVDTVDEALSRLS
jgi:hypothetical protein